MHSYGCLNSDEDKLILKTCKEEQTVIQIKQCLSKKRACFYVLGSDNAGKSSLINSLCQERIIIQASWKRTKHFTRVTYSSIPFVAQFNKQNHLVSFTLKDKIDEEDLINLSEYMWFVLGLPNSNLNQGYDLVDVPPFYMDRNIDNLFWSKIKDDKPMIVFMLNHNFIPTCDMEIIKKLSNFQVFYVVNKLAKEPIEKLYNIEKKLRMAGVTNLLHRLFGIDLWSMNDIYIHKKISKNDVNPFFINQWDSLQTFMKCAALKI